ncbi:sugar transporter [Pedobacter sp. Leaf41]|uniref:protein-disulfide reductase DsbD domain-containing protein n=1 Tax=Pedobacter sp. Leaf41 TaxID=1736218 RepID=UPI000703B423|nr:protein-disulfide reductase DsbD domain-containing protein [Pedobacter sp. Leaf41]KQN36138.1 sugar transporter [Pedobacter sp. Leaf41]
MKKNLFIFTAFMFLTNFCVHAQILEPVKWSYAAKKVNDKEAVVYVKSTINPGWHLYSQFVKEGGPVPTAFTFAPSKTYILVGKTIEPKPITKNEPAFSMEVSYFERTVVFQQKLKLIAKSTVVKGKVEFMICNDKQCLPPSEVEFSVAVK